jgi:hypothetical protein
MTSESEPGKKRAMALGLAVLLFGAGAAAGVAGDRWVASGRSGESRSWDRRRPEATAQQYREELNLDEAQGRSVEEILRRTWASIRQAIAPVEPELDGIRRRGDDEIRALLRPEQRPRFEELVAEQERRRDAMRKGLDLPRRGGHR